MNIRSIVTLIVLIFLSTTSNSERRPHSLMNKFETREADSNKHLLPDQMSDLGARALFEAKISSIDVKSLEFGNDVTYFKLNHPLDFCRQKFINGLEYIVHTKCYRGNDVLLDFTKIYKK